MQSLLLALIAGLAQPGDSTQPETPAAQQASETDAAESAEPARTGDDPLSRSREAEIARVQAWLEGLDTLSARFTQIGPDGATMRGDLYLDRPGRVRFDYDDPSPVLLVADGATVAIADMALETVDRAPIRATPMRWLLSGDLDLTASNAVVEASRHGGELYMTLVDPEGETEGRLTLVFDDPEPSAPPAAMRLQGWYAADSMGGLTQLTLSEIERGVRLDPRLFILDDEDVTGDRRRGRRG